MTATIIDGKAISEMWKEKVKTYIIANGLHPSLAVISVGNNPASEIYIRNKKINCERAGINFKLYTLSENIAEEDLLNLLKELNEDINIHGILVQMPLPPQINSSMIIETINPMKDVDGFHPYNIGRLYSGRANFIACTPLGISYLIKSVTEDIKGKNAVVIGRSLIVGKGIAALLENLDATVTVAHSKTENLSKITKEADILVVAIGKKEIITGDYIKPGAIVIDVGINRDIDGKLYGDVAFTEVKSIAGAITPVPGGVGPMTIAMLLYNVTKAYCLLNKKEILL